MKKSYLVQKRVLLASAALYLEKGDILVHDTGNNNNLTVYRNQKIVRSTPHSVVAISAMVRTGMIQPMDEATTSATPVEAVGLVQQIKENLVVAELKIESAVAEAIDVVKSFAGVEEEAEPAAEEVEPAESTPHSVTAARFQEPVAAESSIVSEGESALITAGVDAAVSIAETGIEKLVSEIENKIKGGKKKSTK